MDHLSTDVFQDLISWIDPDDFKNLRLANRSLDNATEAAFWAERTVKVMINDETDLEVGLKRLEGFRSKPESSAKIQKLEIELSVEEGEEERLRGVLPDALHALQGLRSVRYWISSADPAWLRDTVLEALSALPLLSTLFISANSTSTYDDQPPVPLHYFRHGRLESLSVHARFEDPDLFTSSLSTILAHNPSIGHLDLHFHYMFNTPTQQFSDIFRQPLPKSLQLETLILYGYLAEFTKDVTPHLRSLRRIELHDRQGEFYSHVWDTLRTERIYPRHIIVNNPHENFLEHIESFSGLETLTIRDAGATQQEDSDRLAQRFYRQALLKHQASLRELSISSTGPGLWSYGAWNVDVLDGCMALESLRVNVCEDDIYATEDPEQNIVGKLIRHALALPKLRTLHIVPAFNGRDGGGMSFIASGIGQIGRIVESVRFIPKSRPPLEIKVYGSHGTHLPEASEEGESRFRFVSDF
ncbi:hypothetical protein V5O48_005504 [Marasmius crinis-equi]|uniref:F-box domain-containing protein n=1 Tax=Marasmius crinis-equi TaxID=585013 RepID=A0ABR3FM28_9AGAR